MAMKLLNYVPAPPSLKNAQPPVLMAWRPQGNYLAFTKGSTSIQITDRYGDIFDEFMANTKDKFLGWHKDGDFLAAVGTKQPHVIMYTMSMKSCNPVELGLATKELPTFCLWSPTAPVLVACTNRGNVLYINVHTSRRTPIMGKHQRSITSGAFNEEGLLALASEDATITVSNEQGDTLNSFGCASEPEMVNYVRVHDDNLKPTADYFITAVLTKKTLMVAKALEADTPVNLQFQERYGKISRCLFYERAHVILGFENGWLVILQIAKAPESSQELYSIKEFDSSLTDIAINYEKRMIVSIGDYHVKVRYLDRFHETSGTATLENERTGLKEVSVNKDSSMIAVTGKTGSLFVLLTRIPAIGAAYKDKLASLSSINAIKVSFDTDREPIELGLNIEPSLLAVGEKHVAVVNNNHAWIYDIERISEEGSMVESEYMSTVIKMRLNAEFVMAMLEGRVHLHRIASQQIDEEAVGESMFFPSPSATVDQGSIVDADLSERFLVYCTTTNRICYFSLSDWAPIIDYKHTCGIRKVVTEFFRLQVCFFDERFECHVFCPAAYQAVMVPSEGSNYTDCLWENFTIDRGTFVLNNGQELSVFISNRTNEGIAIQKIGVTAIPYGSTPLMLSKGIVYCMTDSGSIHSFILNSQKMDPNLDGKTSTELRELLKQQLTLRRWNNAWTICSKANDNALWELFASEAMDANMFHIVSRIYKETHNIAMAWTVEELATKDEFQLVKGMIAMYRGNFDEAEHAFLECGHGEMALEMRRDILDWDKAVELARQIKPSEMPKISKEYANQLSFLGKYEEALRHYENAVIEDASDPEVAETVQEHNEFCQAGIARMAIRVGDINRGVNIAQQLPNRMIKKDCGLLLEQLKQYNEAGKLFEVGAFYDRAAAAYIRAKNWTKIRELGDRVRSPKILAQYGKMLEAEKKYPEALKAYTTAGNYDGAVRLMVEHLNMVEDAVKIVRESKSSEGAKIVAKYFSKMNENETAIGFLVISQCYQEAFQMAESENLMDTYADAIEAEQATQQYGPLSQYYSSKQRDNVMAGKFYMLNGEYKTAMDSLLNARDDDRAVPLAIRCAVESKDGALIKTLTNYLLGETDGVPKDPNYIFKLYVNLHMYTEAAKTAMILSEEEQKRGNYKLARDFLFHMIRQLMQNQLRVPADMIDSLILLHSYLIVKTLIKRGEQKIAARMLIRVANKISQFSAHMVDILTSTVIICTKAGLNASAFSFAVQLLRPELRRSISEKYRKKIEVIVRKAKDATDEEEPKSPCPVCNEGIFETLLVCPYCKSRLPCCIITGRHVVADDFALCTGCGFPGYFTEFKKLAAKDEKCPLCSNSVNDVTPSNVSVYLQTKFA